MRIMRAAAAAAAQSVQNNPETTSIKCVAKTQLGLTWEIVLRSKNCIRAATPVGNDA